MKKTLTMMLLALVCSIAAQAHEAEYQPLVREGVVWHYRYCAWDFSYGYIWEDIKMQFKGDSILNGIDYKKCYFYMEDKLPEGSQPFCLAREEDKKVMFCGFKHEVLDTLGAALYYLRGYTDIGETIAYDFGNMQDFVYQIGEDYGEEIQSVSESETDVNGHPAKSYHVTGLGIYDADLIVGVGGDGKNTGFLFGPLTMITTCIFCSLPGGLIKLTDLDGNLLYKGASYDEFYANQTPADYQPLVREGRTWVYSYHFCSVPQDLDLHFKYTLELRGDTVINGKAYKKCFRMVVDKEKASMCDFYYSDSEPVAWLYEKDMQIFVRYNTHPLGYDKYYVNYAEELVYDFGEMRNTLPWEQIEIDGVMCNKYSVDGQPFAVESIGSVVDGDLLFSTWGIGTGMMYDTSNLSHVLNVDGKIIYKAPSYIEPNLLGDINSDGKIDITDVNGVINMILGKGDHAPVDITGDGEVDIADVNAVINAMLGK